MRLNTYEFVNRKVTIIFKTQKIPQPKDIYSFEMIKFMCKYTNSQLPATFNSYIKFITDVHPNNMRRQTKDQTWQIVSPKSRSNSGAKMFKIQCSRNLVKIPLEIKNKPCLSILTAVYK